MNGIRPENEYVQELAAVQEDIARLIKFTKRHRAELEELLNRASNSSFKDSVNELLEKTPELTSRYLDGNSVSFYLRENELGRAKIWAEVLRSKPTKSLSDLRALRLLETKLGNVSKTLTLTHEIAIQDKSVAASGVRLLEGRVRELLGVRPRIPGPVKPISNRVSNRVVHLVKESRPNLSNGFTSRSHKNFLAEKKAGLEPIVITEPGFPDNNPRTHREFVDGILHIRLGFGDINYSQLPVDQFNQLFADLAYEEIKNLRPEFIHASSGRRGYETALVGLALKYKTEIPLVYEVRSFFEANWTDNTALESTGEIFECRMAIEKVCMDESDRVLTICHTMKDDLVARGIDPNKIGIIPNAVDLDHFSPMQRDVELAATYSLSDFATFGYVSNMDHYRESQETLIEAMAELKQRGVRAKCVLVGGGPRADKLKKLAIDFGVEQEVIFTGAVDHNLIDKYYSLIDVFVVPRIAERAATFVTPLKPFEAMAELKPVVTSDLPALIEITRAPERGLSFAAGNSIALADTLESLFHDEDLQRNLARAGRDWVKEERTWDLNGERYVSEFSKLKGK
ncbi:glycosyltransferase family 4 protein [Glutamicibacter endophyticus]|uniref:glycosyltransferase family 4 protein n=1 Tax=Glutamicibacter endophyticus TaxID=1522174 RepID=UPI003AEF8C49